MPKYPVISEDPEVQAFYVAARRAGSSHAGAEMLALQEAPGLHGTDSKFMAGMESGKQFEKAPWMGREYKRISERLRPGCSSGSAVYKQQLAKFPGDPDAWVKDTSDVKRAAAIKGVDVDGMVKCRNKGREKKPVAIAPDIVNSMVRAKIARDPSLGETPKKRKMLRREVLEKHTLPSRRQYIKDD